MYRIVSYALKIYICLDGSLWRRIRAAWAGWADSSRT